MGNWLAQVNPNTVIAAVLGIVGLFGVGKHVTASGVLAHAKDLLESELAHIVDKWLVDGGADKTRDMLEVEAWKLLDKVGIERSDAVELAVHAAVSVAWASFYRRAQAAAASKLPPDMVALAKQVEDIVNLFANPKPLVPVEMTGQAVAPVPTTTPTPTTNA